MQHYTIQAKLTRDALILIAAISVLVTPVTVFIESYRAAQHYRQQQLSGDTMTAKGLNLHHVDRKILGSQIHSVTCEVQTEFDHKLPVRVSAQ